MLLLVFFSSLQLGLHIFDEIMADSSSSGPPATGPDGRPLGPDGKPLPGPQQMQQVMAQRRMAQQVVW